MLEVWLTGVLMFVVLSVSTSRPEIQSLGGFIAGGVIALEVLFCGPVTGASMNPARSLAPAVVGGKMEFLWLYLIAPPLGAVIAVIIWKVLHQPQTSEVKL